MNSLEKLFEDRPKFSRWAFIIVSIIVLMFYLIILTDDFIEIKKDLVDKKRKLLSKQHKLHQMHCMEHNHLYITENKPLCTHLNNDPSDDHLCKMFEDSTKIAHGIKNGTLLGLLTGIFVGDFEFAVKNAITFGIVNGAITSYEYFLNRRATHVHNFNDYFMNKKLIESKYF